MLYRKFACASRCLACGGKQASVVGWIPMPMLIYFLLLCFSAGLFEKTARWLFMQWKMREDNSTEAVIFGLGIVELRPR